MADETETPVNMDQPLLKVRLVEGADAMEAEGPEGTVLHIINEWRLRTDKLREEASAMMDRMYPDGRQGRRAGPGREGIELHN